MMRVRTFSTILCFICLTLVGCQTTEFKDRDSDSEESSPWLRTELYFAIGLIPRDEVESTTDSLGEGKAMWEDFLDNTVTPLFPDGLTVFDAVGQWLSDRFEKPPHLETKVLVILHPDTEEANEKIEKIREAFLKLTGQQSVLRVTAPAEVSF